MALSVSLTEQRLLEIMGKIYIKGQESEKINVIELIEEIKQQVVQEK
ncbi:hypothetical protein [Neobacillus vireti]|nr:hypothetical protein [Neobacillus vireti]